MAYIMPCFSRIRSEMLPAIHTVKKINFFKAIIHSTRVSFSVLNVTCFVHLRHILINMDGIINALKLNWSFLLQIHHI